MSLLLYFYYKYHQRQVALATADDMQRLIHRNLALLLCKGIQGLRLSVEHRLGQNAIVRKGIFISLASPLMPASAGQPCTVPPHWCIRSQRGSYS